MRGQIDPTAGVHDDPRRLAALRRRPAHHVELGAGAGEDGRRGSPAGVCGPPALRHGVEQPAPRLGRAGARARDSSTSCCRRPAAPTGEPMLPARGTRASWPTSSWAGAGPEPVFAPVRALSTSGSNEDNSSLARQEEMRNLIYTLSAAGNPLLGTGWGSRTEGHQRLRELRGRVWWQYLYLPHNSLLGVAVFGGLVGICGIWLVVPVAAFLATRGYRGATGTVDRAAAMAAVCILPAYGAQCYGDIGFQSLTVQPDSRRGDGGGRQGVRPGPRTAEGRRSAEGGAQARWSLRRAKSTPERPGRRSLEGERSHVRHRRRSTQDSPGARPRRGRAAPRIVRASSRG